MMQSLIPKEQKIIGYEDELRTLSYAIEKNIPVLLTGETGVGKTSLIRHLAHEAKRPLRRVNLNGQTTVDEFVGKTLLNKTGTFWQDGVLIEAMREGYWLVLDELNAALPEILFVLHSLLDDDRYVVLSEKDGEVVRPHEDFRIFATMNPSGRYTGTKDLNKAFLSRFPMILQIDFPNEEQEKAVLAHFTSLTMDQRTSLVKMAGQLRNAYEKDDIEYVCSTRDLISCGLLEPQFGMRKALDLAIMAKVPATDLSATSTIVDLYFGRTGVAKAKDELVEVNALNTRLKQTVKELAMSTTRMVQINIDAVNSLRRLRGMDVDEVEEAINKTLKVTKGLTGTYMPAMTSELHGSIHVLKELQFDKIEDAKEVYSAIKQADDDIHNMGAMATPTFSPVSTTAGTGAGTGTIFTAPADIKVDEVDWRGLTSIISGASGTTASIKKKGK